MPRAPQVRVRDLETDHEYLVTEAKYERQPHLYERLGAEPAKTRTTVDEAMARKRAEAEAAAQNGGQQADLNRRREI